MHSSCGAFFLAVWHSSTIPWVHPPCNQSKVRVLGACALHMSNNDVRVQFCGYRVTMIYRLKICALVCAAGEARGFGGAPTAGSCVGKRGELCAVNLHKKAHVHNALRRVDFNCTQASVWQGTILKRRALQFWLCRWAEACPSPDILRRFFRYILQKSWLRLIYTERDFTVK